LCVEGDDGLAKALIHVPTTIDGLVRWIDDSASKYVRPANDDDLPDCPVLARARLAAAEVAESQGRGLTPEERAIETIGGLMREFRQDRPHVRGRSRWPEPNAISKLVPGCDPRHAPPSDAPVYFPRGILGLPIVFHFKGESALNCELVGRSNDRMASPLVVRPARLASGRLVVLALRFNTPSEPPDGLALRLSSKSTQAIDPAAGPLDGAKLAVLVPPLAERQASDAVQAFLRKVRSLNSEARLLTLAE
jgi:hypothetical protein